MNRTAARAASNCTGTKAAAEDGSIPANVSVNTLPMVTAGLANEVEVVKKYADAM